MLVRTQEVPGYAPVSESSAERFIHRHGQLKTYKRHALIYSAGDPATQIFVISSGEVKISRYTPVGRELTLDQLNADSIFGETEVLMGKRRDSQAAAGTDLVVYAVDKDSLMSYLESDPKFVMWLIHQMAVRQAQMESRLESLLFKSAKGKVSQVLLRLAKEHGQQLKEGIMINYPITHQEIGNLIATTRESVSNAFMEFRQLGLISTRQRKTILHDLDGLSQIALS